MHPHRQRHDPSKSLVGFLVGDVRYAVPIADVREITNPLEIVELPHAPHAVAGVADFRGEVVPVVDLRVRFGFSATVRTRRTKWILVDVGDRVVALVVDGVTEVFGTGGVDLRPAPPLGSGEDMRGIAGVLTRDKALVFVLETTGVRQLTASIGTPAELGPALFTPKGSP
jgi:purine-binding chemotaxis protein CheW